VLDSRLLTEYFYSENSEIKENASKKVKELLQSKEGILPTIVISETIQVVCQRIGKQEAEICYATLIKSGLQIQNLTPQIAKHAGLLKSKYRNVPMGDCIIAATAQANQARIVSDDVHFDLIVGIKRIWI
jgi:predicted nucleic acid-binding protein